MFRLLARIGERELRHLVGESPVLLGAGDDCDFVLREPTVSRRHARLLANGDGLLVEDLGSRNGVFVDRQRVSGSSPLRVGQVLRLGEVEIRIELAAWGDAELAVAGVATPTRAVAPQQATLGTAPLSRFCTTQLPGLLHAAASGEDGCALVARILKAMAQSEPGLAVDLLQGEGLLASAGSAPPQAERLVLSRQGLSLVLSCTGELLPLARQMGAVALDLATLVMVRKEAGAIVARQRDDGDAPSPPSSAHPPLVEIYRRAALVARSRINVLIEGETGTGKELLARYLHEASGLTGERFVALNCAALPRDLLDAELFGIEAGVATGVSARAGKFEQAHGGTLFLDEIADMAPETQARLLRVLQEGRVYRIGGKESRLAQVRVVSACNRSLDEMVARGEFRLDLFHRIADWPLRLPPLRERQEDIANLAAHFLQNHCGERGIGFGGISRAAVDALQAYAWPGNVRELEREMARVSLFLNDGEVVDSSLLKPAISAAGLQDGSGDISLEAGLEREERRLIEAALRACDGNVLEAAARLGVGKSTLYRRLQHFGLGER